jgi:dTDP-4-amino-4,6-dideoxygalactose transaminase
MYRIGQEEISAVERVIKSRSLFKINDSLQEVKHFEEELREKLGCKYAICMSSGTGALISGLVAMGIGPGDEVIVPAYTYIATAIAVTAVGAIPVITEIDETMTIDVEDIKKKISPYTKAIIPVHIQGFPSKMDEIMRIAKEHNIFVLEDACQSDGGSYKGKRLGTWGDAGTFSFNHYKIITSGEGGALLTDNRKIFERALIHHDSCAVAYFGNQLEGISEPVFAGIEFRVSEITGAILREQLKKLDGIIYDLRRIKKQMICSLKDTGLKFTKSNDPDGDLGTTLSFVFEDEQKARKFAKSENIRGVLPIDTGKHVYTNWTPILEKRGALHDKMNPFKMEANKALNMNYSSDMCPKTLDILRRTVYVGINPDWTEEQVNAKIDAIKNAIA